MDTLTAVTLWLLHLTLCLLTNHQALAKSLTYPIEEELPTNTLIGNVPMDAHLDAKYNITILGKLRFSFLTIPPELTDNMFSLEDRSGILQTIGRVDRDTICPSLPRCELVFDIAVRPAKFFQILKVKIQIADVNDNQPKFPQTHLVYQISESALPGKSFSIPAASDPDSGRHGVQHYELVSQQKKFQLKVRETADGAIDLRLVLMEELDRETDDFYQVKIVASDGGRPVKSGSILIDVHILDANDNDPKFQNASYEVSVLENVPVGTGVTKVKARDPDQGVNGKVEYSFSRHTEQNYGALFGIDSETGEIFVKAELDYEKAYIYLLSVTAQDKGPDSLPAQANVVVRVQDVDDNAPQITVNTLTTTGDAHVTENTPPGTFVAHISVMDADSGDNGKVTCSLDNDKFLLQKLYLTEYKIVTASTFDRERQPYFDLRLRCMDHGERPLSSFAHIRVTVMDENDHAPEFSQQFYSSTMTENNNINDLILVVTASDRDEGKNGWVHYKVADDARNMVNIDQDTGWVTANVIFDHEQVQELRFHVIASDKGAEPRSSTATILITVLDVDDERPEFQQPSYRFGAFENEQAGAEVGQVIAQDKDSDPYNYFTYRLDKSRSPTDVFEIDPYNGNIRTKQVLDREDRPVYYLVAVAQGDSSSKSSSTSISVYVADKNDNSPEFKFPDAKNNTIHVSNLVPTGHVITRIQAQDRDSGKNAKLTFHVNSGNEEDYFTLDKTTGAVKVNRDLSQFKKQTFVLHIRVEDEGEPQLASLADLQIIVNNALGYQPLSTGMHISRDNLIILIVFGAATIVISTIIIATIVIIRRKDRRQERADDKKAGETEKMLSGEEQSNPGPRNISPASNHQTYKRYITTKDMGKMKKANSRDSVLVAHVNSADTSGRNALKGPNNSAIKMMPANKPEPEPIINRSINLMDAAPPSAPIEKHHPDERRGQHNSYPMNNSRALSAQNGTHSNPHPNHPHPHPHPRPDVVCKPPARSATSPMALTPSGNPSGPIAHSPGPASVVGFGELHPHNLIRDSPDQEVVNVQRLRGSPADQSGYSTLPLPVRNPASGRSSPRHGGGRTFAPPQTAHKDNNYSGPYGSQTLNRGRAGSLIEGPPSPHVAELNRDYVVFNCDLVPNDRTTDV